MDILIGILPALLWGVGPLIATKFGGKPVEQVLGTGYGQLAIGIIIYLFTRPAISFQEFLWPFLGGVAWAVAQYMQFSSFTKMNVSTAMPISTGLQLIEIPLCGVIFFGEWGSPLAKLIGFLSIALLILGTTCTSYVDKGVVRKKLDYKAGMPLLIIGSFGYTACSVFPRITNASGLVGLLPQTFGMFLGAVVVTFVLNGKEAFGYLKSKVTFKSGIIGLLGGLGTLAYLTSLKLNGVANAFPLTQMNVVVSTLGGLIILKENKNKKEIIFTVIGLLMIVVAAILIGHLE
ncbi:MULTISPECIES: GRP family sugar transporter [Apilactobacillus]|uniref:GRP family sugar transporter n=1 Tax=Apilactobacillus TaxID=2767877 RepID=UPI0006B24334|nr:GRP family sugar transporter [Apilactobacillus kunkeei]KOY70210.1 putative ribose uptake protein rbsU [Apilactobacillus kunkeei]MCK8620436.1 GRP family sugar transporter [Apilactobacillus kunkeei]MCK8628735.1 GRP family sugar transporter [Apilactobacillus kunkeei]MCK8633896.1 GRP family sugar transporter [Apilactobacillus kunkeei]NBI00112.1 ribose uptake protein RbsU [Apilactobacillus kunkeei]